MERHDLHVAPVWEAMSTTALVNAVIHGLGIAVVPRRMVSGVVEMCIRDRMNIHPRAKQVLSHLLDMREKGLRIH